MCQNLIHTLQDGSNIINLLIMMRIWMTLYEYKIYICHIQVVTCNCVSSTTYLKQL